MDTGNILNTTNLRPAKILYATSPNMSQGNANAPFLPVTVYFSEINVYSTENRYRQPHPNR